MGTNATAHAPDMGALRENGAYTTSALDVASRDLSPSRENARRVASDLLMHRVKGTSTNFCPEAKKLYNPRVVPNTGTMLGETCRALLSLRGPVSPLRKFLMSATLHCARRFIVVALRAGMGKNAYLLTIERCTFTKTFLKIFFTRMLQ